MRVNNGKFIAYLASEKGHGGSLVSPNEKRLSVSFEKRIAAGTLKTFAMAFVPRCRARAKLKFSMLQIR